MTSLGFVWINTQGNGRHEQIEAGRAYMRVALQAAADGLAIQPMSQALQEYPEMAQYYETVHATLAADLPPRLRAEFDALLARLAGYVPEAGPER